MTPVVALADEAASRDAASSQAVASDGALQDSALAAETVEESAVVVERRMPRRRRPRPRRTLAPAAGDASIAQDAAASDALPDWIPEGGYDKAEFWRSRRGWHRMLSDSARAASVYPVKISKDMLYFGAYEGGTYDRTFSYGDGYHALGFYQFDHRYGLQNFLIACYNYDPRSSRCSSSSSPFRCAVPGGDAIRRSTKRASTISRRWARPSMKHGWRRRADGEGSRGRQHLRAPAGRLGLRELLHARRALSCKPRHRHLRSQRCGERLVLGHVEPVRHVGLAQVRGGVSDGYDWNGRLPLPGVEPLNWPGAGLN